MPEFLPAAYGPVLAPLVSGKRCRALDRGRRDEQMRGPLELATVEAAFAQAPLTDRGMAACCIAGVWLVHDFLDESHAISQSVESPTGAFWHGIMHRREGDFSNAKYWFRRVGSHPVLAELSAWIASPSRNAESVQHAPRIAPRGEFDPLLFVDACQAALRDRNTDFNRRVQQAEWELLFDFSYREAVSA